MAIFILILPLSSALDVSELEFYHRGEPIGAVSTSSTFPSSDMKIVVTGIDFESFNVDYSGLHSNIMYAQTHHYFDTMVHKTTCDKIDNSTFECWIRSIKLKLPQANVNINFKIHGNETVEVNKSYTFSIDNTRPTIVSLGPDSCTTENCSVPSGKYIKMKFQFQDSPGSFDDKNVAYKLGTSGTILVQNCSGMTCYGNPRITCAHDQTISLSIIKSQTFDDAFNMLDNSMTKSLLCDAEKPKLKNISIEATSGLNITRAGDAVSIVVDVIENSEHAPKVYMNLTHLGGEALTKTCVRYANNWRCEFIASIPEDHVPFDAIIDYVLMDSVGNTNELTKTFFVYGLDQDAAPNYWAVETKLQSPTTMSKNHMEFPRIVSAQVSLIGKSGSPEIVALENARITCEGVDAQSKQAPLAKVEIMNSYPGINSLYVQAWMPAGGSYYNNVSKVTYNCSVGLLTKKGRYATRVYEKDNFFLEVKFDSVQSMSQLLQEEIDRVQKSSTDTQKVIDDISQYLNPLYSMCKIVQKVNIVKGALGAADSALGYAAKVYAPLEGISGIFDGVTGAINGVAGDVLEPLANEVCPIITCSAKWQEKITDAVADWPGLEGMAKAAGYDNAKQLLNPYNNMLASVAKVCAPAILYHIQTYNTIDCHYLNCLKLDVQNFGVSISACTGTRNYAQCKFIWGGVFDSFPYTALAGEIGDTVEMLISDPVTLFGTALGLLCKPMKGFAIIHGACVAMNSLEEVNAFYHTVKQIGEPLGLSLNGEACEAAIRIDPDTELYMTTLEVAELYSQGSTYNSSVPGYSDTYKTIPAGSTVKCTVYGGCGLVDKNGNPTGYSVKLINPDGSTVDPNNLMIFYENGKSYTYEDYYAQAKLVADAAAKAAAAAAVAAAAAANDPAAAAAAAAAEVAAAEAAANADATDHLASDAVQKPESTPTEEGDGIPSLEVVDRTLNDQMKQYTNYITALKLRLNIDDTDLNNPLNAYINAINAHSEGETTAAARNAAIANQNEQLDQYEILLAQLSAVNDRLSNGDYLDVENINEGDLDLTKETEDDLRSRILELEDNIANSKNEYNENLPDNAKKLGAEGVSVEDIRDENTAASELVTKDLEDANKAKDRAAKRLKNDEKYNIAWGTNAEAYKHAVAFGRLTSQVVGPDGFLGASSAGWSATVDKALDSDVGQAATAGLDTLVCNAIRGTAETGTPTTSPIISAGSYDYPRTAAHIEGIRNLLYNASGDTYQYIITGGVLVGDHTSGLFDGDAELEFELWIDNKVVTDLIPEAGGNSSITLPGDKAIKFSGSSSIIFADDHLYSKVCIKFLGNQLNRFFDDTSGLSGGNMLCQNFVEGK